VNITSLSGDVVLQQHLEVSDIFTNTHILSRSKKTFNVLPSSLNIVSFGGSIDIPNDVILLPSETSNLSLISNNDISTKWLLMSDYDPALLPLPTAPGGDLFNFFKIVESNAHASYLLHENDDIANVIISKSGNISGIYYLPKQSIISAGNDIKNFGYIGQNIHDTDTTIIEAGRDIRFTQSEAIAAERIQLGGPGSLDLLAGRNIDLGASYGVTTLGNQVNGELDSQGASINVIVGIAEGLDTEAFIEKYISTNSHYIDIAVEYMRDYLDDSSISEEIALNEFNNLGVIDQRPLIIDILFRELRSSGRNAATGEGSYEQGYNAINTLFPSDRKYDGDLAMYLSRIYTTDGGDINVLVPGGLANAGLAAATTIDKEPSELGIVAQRSGDVKLFMHDDLIVNQSRVFTLLGGDILIWTSFGDIDAGRGAKSAISAPEPTISFDIDGNVTFDFGGAIAGSGIRAITTQDDVEPGDVDLYAPVGVVDAGDAGIDAGGNLFIGAEQVLGADNINVGGVSVGVPSAGTGNLAAGLTGTENMANDANSVSDQAVDSASGSNNTPISDSALSFLEVNILGFGEMKYQNEEKANCHEDDMDCKKVSGS
jgi:hypothetical protein